MRIPRYFSIFEYPGAKGSRPGRSGVIVLPRGDTGGPGALAILQVW